MDNHILTMKPAHLHVSQAPLLVADLEDVSLAILGLEVLVGANTLQPTVDHDANAVTQRISLQKMNEAWY